MYMRGQLTIFRNDYFINNLWRQCPYFSLITTRMKTFFQSKQRPESRTKGWRFQSAEGCISKIVTDQQNLTIYVASTQISDAFHASLTEKESVILGSILMRCYQQPLDISSFIDGDMQRRSSLYLSISSFERSIDCLRVSQMKLSPSSRSKNHRANIGLNKNIKFVSLRLSSPKTLI
jgi:hypothetical protein